MFGEPYDKDGNPRITCLGAVMGVVFFLLAAILSTFLMSLFRHY